MRFLFTTLSAGIIGLVAGYLWQWNPVVGPQAMERQRLLETSTGAAGENGKADSAERFLAALQNTGDPLRMEHDLWLAVQSLGEDDLGIVSADWAGVMAITKRFDYLDYSTREAVLGAVINKWLTLDPEGAMSRLKQLIAAVKPGEYIPQSVIVAVAKKQPRALFEFLLATQDSERRSGMIYTALWTWGTDQIALSEALIAQAPEAQRQQMQLNFESVRAAMDPEFGLLTTAQKTADSDRSLILRSTGEALAKLGSGAVADALARNPQWEKKDREVLLEGLIAQNPAGAALIIADAPPEQWSSRSVKLVAKALAARDSERALAWSAKLSGEQRAIAEGEIAVIMSDKNPGAALALLPAQSSTARSRVLRNWLMADEPAARAWVNAQPPEFSRSELFEHLINTRRTDEAVRMIASDSEPRMVGYVASALAKKDTRAAADWAAALPAGATQNTAIGSVVHAFAADEPDAAGEWVASFPPGLARDHAVRALVDEIAAKQADAAREWTEQIEDRWQKTRAAIAVHHRWRIKDWAAADAWFSAVPGIYETSRAEKLSGL